MLSSRRFAWFTSIPLFVMNNIMNTQTNSYCSFLYIIIIFICNSSDLGIPTEFRDTKFREINFNPKPTNKIERNFSIEKKVRNLNKNISLKIEMTGIARSDWYGPSLLLAVQCHPCLYLQHCHYPSLKELLEFQKWLDGGCHISLDVKCMHYGSRKKSYFF